MADKIKSPDRIQRLFDINKPKKRESAKKTPTPGSFNAELRTYFIDELKMASTDVEYLLTGRSVLGSTFAMAPGAVVVPKFQEKIIEDLADRCAMVGTPRERIAQIVKLTAENLQQSWTAWSITPKGAVLSEKTLDGGGFMPSKATTRAQSKKGAPKPRVDRKGAGADALSEHDLDEDRRERLDHGGDDHEDDVAEESGKDKVDDLKSLFSLLTLGDDDGILMQSVPKNQQILKQVEDTERALFDLVKEFAVTNTQMQEAVRQVEKMKPEEFTASVVVTDFEKAWGFKPLVRLALHEVVQAFSSTADDAARARLALEIFNKWGPGQSVGDITGAKTAFDDKCAVLLAEGCSPFADTGQLAEEFISALGRSTFPAFTAVATGLRKHFAQQVKDAAMKDEDSVVPAKRKPRTLQRVVKLALVLWNDLPLDQREQSTKKTSGLAGGGGGGKVKAKKSTDEDDEDGPALLAQGATTATIVCFVCQGPHKQRDTDPATGKPYHGADEIARAYEKDKRAKPVVPKPNVNVPNKGGGQLNKPPQLPNTAKGGKGKGKGKGQRYDAPKARAGGAAEAAEEEVTSTEWDAEAEAAYKVLQAQNELALIRAAKEFSAGAKSRRSDGI